VFAASRRCPAGSGVPLLSEHDYHWLGPAAFTGSQPASCRHRAGSTGPFLESRHPLARDRRLVVDLPDASKPRPRAGMRRSKGLGGGEMTCDVDRGGRIITSWERLACFGERSTNPSWHLIVARAVLENLATNACADSRPNPPHKVGRGMEDAANGGDGRCCRGEPHFEVSDCELRRAGLSSRFHVEAFRQAVGSRRALPGSSGATRCPNAQWLPVARWWSVAASSRRSAGYEIPDLNRSAGRCPPSRSSAPPRRLPPRGSNLLHRDRSAFRLRLSIRYLVHDPIRAYIDRHGFTAELQHA